MWVIPGTPSSSLCSPSGSRGLQKDVRGRETTGCRRSVHRFVFALPRVTTALAMAQRWRHLNPAGKQVRQGEGSVAVVAAYALNAAL